MKQTTKSTKAKGTIPKGRGTLTWGQCFPSTVTSKRWDELQAIWNDYVKAGKTVAAQRLAEERLREVWKGATFDPPVPWQVAR
jgi:hypothetical protein